MKYEIRENGILMIFETDGDKKLSLKYVGKEADFTELSEKEYPAFEFGSNPGFSTWNKKIHTESIGFIFKDFKDIRTDLGRQVLFILENGNFEVILTYNFYNGISAFTSSSSVKNISSKKQNILYISSFNYSAIKTEEPVYIMNNSWYEELCVKKMKLSDFGINRIVKHSSKRIFVSNTGTNSAKEYLPMGGYGGLLWQIENNGSWQWELGDREEHLYISLSGPSEETGWNKKLMPGEVFESVRAAIAVGNDFDDALGELTKYRRLIKGTNSEFLKQPVIFNDYMNCLWASPTTENELPMIDAASDAGAEYYCMDAGWYAEGTWWDLVGEWIPNDTRFPNGIKEVFDYVRQKGMKPGIWVEPEVMGVNCPLADKMPDECFFMRDGKRVVNRGRYQLDFRNKTTFEYMTNVIRRLIDDLGLCYFKFDYNIDAGVGTEIGAYSYGDGLLQNGKALLEWIRNLKKLYPHVIFENCSSGGLRMDYAMLSEYHLQSTSDQTECIHTSAIAANSSIGVLPEQAGIWAYPMEMSSEKEVIFNMVNGMAGCLYLSGRIDLLDENRISLVKAAVAAYKDMRDDVKEFIPFYPCGLNDYKKPERCVCYKAGNKLYTYLWNAGDSAEFFIPTDKKNVRCIYPENNKFKIVNEKDGIRFISEEKLDAAVYVTE